MKKNVLSYSLILLALGLFSCDMANPDTYARSVEKYRFSKDSFYKYSQQSPLGAKERMPFIKLNYYDVDSTYRVQATLEKFISPQPISMEMSEGLSEQYFRMGRLHFKLHGKSYMLTVYQSADFLNSGENANQLFLPFTDATNGKTTYGGGRFIDITYNGDSLINLDFNYAYNPSCAYNHSFSCPVPPAENHLNTPIKAGEKLYGDIVRFF